jgi:hypothetical protein
MTTCNIADSKELNLSMVPYLATRRASVSKGWMAKMALAVSTVVDNPDWIMLKRYYEECVPEVEDALKITFKGSTFSLNKDRMTLHFEIDPDTINVLPKYEAFFHFWYLNKIENSDMVSFKISVPLPQYGLF